MSQVQTIFKNMSWILVSQIIACICGFIWTVLIARYMSVSEYGILGFAISLTGIISFTMDWGISTHIVRHISTDHSSAPKYVGNAIPLKGIFSIGTIFLTLVILILMKSDEVTICVTLLFLIQRIVLSLNELIIGCFQAFEEGKYQGIRNTILNLLQLIFILIAIFSDLGIYGITFAYLLANVITCIYSYYVLVKHITKPKYEINKNFCKKITKVSIPFAVTGLLFSIYYSIDMIMLTHLVGNYETGVYNATYKLISVLTLFYSVYGSVIFPVMSRLYKNNEKLLIVSFEKSIKYLTLIMVPIAVGTVLYSLDIIRLIYGHKYDAASAPLSILIWTVCLLFINGPCNSLLNASHKEVSVTKIYLIAAAFNFTLNLIMIPYLTYTGAAITTVLSDLLILIIQFYVIYKSGQKPNKKLYYDIGKIIIGSTILAIALHLLNLNMWLALPVGIIIYFATLYLLKLFDKDDKYVIKEILGKN
ncbi:Membrane protein involved in the export of O-antigen and teichoic acid [Methanobrevibacter millerae]|uniref:Membrane protein involved in the export of O-antigen and teichoic acid n=2 Tax=Methanobrevibacter millerae TaxID=230361 RepID=A0A1G5WXA3_9EURY|nr:Membrane protein involved in the export of O-antigen and teichoic acid [Methanobrevibacter millerae]